jgi:CheY-like chemotaxis protein
MAIKELRLDNPVHTARNGADAIAYLAGQGAYSDRSLFPFPSLMILDVKMPVRDGFEVLAWWQRSAHPEQLPVIVYSGSDLPSDIDTAQSLGAAAYRVKPSNYRGTLEFAKELRDVWLAPRVPGAPKIAPEFFRSSRR